jgi:hypothetical protein
VRLGLTGLLFGLPVSLLGLRAFNTAITAEAGIHPSGCPTSPPSSQHRA